MKTQTRSNDITDPDTAPAPRVEVSPLGESLISLVDAALSQMVGRGTVGSIEVVDLLLDLRSRMVLEHALAEVTAQSTEGR